MTTIAVAVVLRRGELLVGRRSARAADAAGLDEFPGGKVEPGESPADAAARECLEESGIAVQVGRLLDRATARTATGPLEILFFAAAPLDDHAEPLVPFAWTPLAELASRRFPAANAGVLAALGQGGS
ncbi:MAG: NUDIX domain-containing protein [Planctomycetota bacterium]